MVLQVLDLVSTTSEPFYGDCPTQYTDLDVNASNHTTCTVLPQGILIQEILYSLILKTSKCFI